MALCQGDHLNQARIVVCTCGAAVRVRELRFELGRIRERDWALRPWCSRKAYEMEEKGVIVVEANTEADWDLGNGAPHLYRLPLPKSH